jgi:hypothetical protein
MTILSSKELENKQKSDRKKGEGIVIFGAIASVILWLIILAEGGPIKPFTAQSSSFAYAVGIAIPIIVISILALVRASRDRSSA